MIIPSIDIQAGEVVQLVGGEELALKAGEPLPILKRFRVAGEVAAIDLDAARGIGDNSALMKSLLRHGDLRVGGGIRSRDSAIEWLDAGAKKIILGTAANPNLLQQLPKDRVIAAVDALNGEVVIEGWRRTAEVPLLQRLNELREYVSGFLVTFVESEGRLQGIDMSRVREVIRAASPVRVTIAGGVSTLEELREIHNLGADAQVGMALYKGAIDLGEAICTSLSPAELWPTVVCNARKEVLGLVYSNVESVKAAVSELRGIYHSRKRGLWKKGDSSGAFQDLLKIESDCDGDTLRFIVQQHGDGFCHLGSYSCWGNGSVLTELERKIMERSRGVDKASYSSRLLNDSGLLNSKILEEAAEVVAASNSHECYREASDLLYFLLVKLIAMGSSLSEVENELNARTLRITRRPGDAKVALKTVIENQ